jgi:hypothetical protein
MIDYLDPNKLEDTVADSVGKDLGELAEVEGHLAELRQQFAALPADAGELKRSELALEISRALQILNRGSEAWPLARQTVDLFIQAQAWEQAADACNILYQTSEPGFLNALGQGVWLGVTYPIDAELTIELLSHVVDDTPDDSDGAAVAAATASFIADIRTQEGPEKERMSFFTQQLLSKVARRHSEVGNEQQFKYWIEKLELDQPDKFLVRLRNIVDVLVQEDWWFDREALQSRIPEA